MIHDLSPLAWSPLGGGWLAAPTLEPSQYNDQAAKLHAFVGKLAKQYNTSRQNVCLAFLLKHPSKIIPIIGTTDAKRIADAVQSLDIELSREDWYQLYVVAKGESLP